MANLAGSLLLRHKLVSAQQIAAAHALRQREGGSFGECLVRIGAVDEEALVEFYHKRLMVPRLPDAKLMIVSPRVLSLVPSDMAAEFRVLPVDLDGDGNMTLAMADPSDNHAVDEIAFFADKFVVRSVATESAVRRAVETHYGVRFSSPPSTVPARRDRPGPSPREASVRAPAPVPVPVEHKESSSPVVLLTKIKRSEETPLPMPIPPPGMEPELPQSLLVEEPSEPILLTRPKRSTLPKIPAIAPDPPLAALREVGDRDGIATLVLDYMSDLCRRAVFFIVKKELLAGQDARGDGLDGSSIRQLAIALEAPSIFRDVISSRLPYRGPLPETAANRAFAATIGGVESEVLIMPIAIRDRIVGCLYADKAYGPLPDAALHAVTREAGLAYERLILSGKRR